MFFQIPAGILQFTVDGLNPFAGIVRHGFFTEVFHLLKPGGYAVHSAGDAGTGHFMSNCRGGSKVSLSDGGGQTSLFLAGQFEEKPHEFGCDHAVVTGGFHQDIDIYAGYHHAADYKTLTPKCNGKEMKS